MSRSSSKLFHLHISIACFFLVGFIFGIRYWQRFLPLPCTTPPRRSQPSFYDHFQFRTINTCHRKDNNQLFLTIAILSSYDRLLIYLPSILKTWILTSTKDIEVILFIEELSGESDDFLEQTFVQLNQNQQIKACFFLVKLKHVENEYPPQKKSFYAMKFLYAFYRQRSFWLLRLDDNAYVNIEPLVKWLRSIDHRRALYIGQSGTGRRNGPPIYFSPGQYFCMGGSGVILSQRTLNQLGPWLDHCLIKEVRTKHEDVELGRCIFAHVHIGCSNAFDSKVFFYHHYGPGYSFGEDFTPSIVTQAFILHPVKDRNTFEQLFAFLIRQKQSISTESSVSIRGKRSPYVTYLPKIEFDLTRDVHYQAIDVRWKMQIEKAVQSFLEKTRRSWHQHSSNWTLTNGKFLFGYHRMIPSVGLDMLAEVFLNIQSVGTYPVEFRSARKRFHISQAFVQKDRLSYREITSIHNNETIYQLNLIVVSSNKDQALKRFIDNFRREIFLSPSRHSHFTLTILYFSPNNQTNEYIRNLIHQLTIRYLPLIRLSFIDQQETSYNRGLGRQLASKLFTDNQLLFFLDVDLIFTGQALDNTRRLMIHQLSISSCAVYFPIIFSGFSPKFTHAKGSNVVIHPKNGIFSIYGFGNVAVRKQDLDRIGGWETENHDWGVEDVNLFHRFSVPYAECRVFRAVEPGLRHTYHRKMCNNIENTAREKMCREADAVLLGSQAAMANYLYTNKKISL